MEDNYENQNESNQNQNVERIEGTTSYSYEQSGSQGGSSKSFKEASPDEVKHKVKETVQKGVAAVAGALKGFSEEAKKHDLAGSTKEAINKAGETTRQVVGTTAEEFQRTKEHVKEKAKGTGSTASSGMGSSSLGSSNVGNLGGSSTSGTSNVRGTSYQENAMQDVTDNVPKNKAGTTGMPDLRKTDLSKTDRELEE